MDFFLEIFDQFNFIFPKLRISVISGKKFVLYARMGSSVSVSDPAFEDMLRISIFDNLSLLGTKLLVFVSGSESQEILKVSIIGDTQCIPKITELYI